MIDDLLKEMEKYAAVNRVPIITERARDVFRKIIRSENPMRVLEIGTAIGYSALLIAEESKNKVLITSLELDEKRAMTAQKYIARSPYAEQIEIRTGDAGEILQTLSSGYDFVFIDAAKGQYPDYWRKIQPLLNKKATVLADNVLFRGYVRGDIPAPRRFKTIVKRLQEYISLTENTTGFVTEILENGDGLAVSRRI